MRRWRAVYALLIEITLIATFIQPFFARRATSCAAVRSPHRCLRVREWRVHGEPFSLGRVAQVLICCDEDGIAKAAAR